MIFSFKYDGVNSDKINFKKSIRTEVNKTITELALPDGLKITNIKTDLSGASEWVTWYENTGNADSQVLSEIYDCDVRIAFEYDSLPESRAFVANGVNTLIFNPQGSIWDDEEFTCETEKISSANKRYAAIFPGDSKRYSTDGGRSSQTRMPFFDINRLDCGVIFAVGWTGQWFCNLERDDECIHITAGIEKTEFYLKPGEKIRTASIMMF